MSFRIQLRRDSAADWTSANPVLASGEVGHESDTGLFKIGDGSTAWTSLDYQPSRADIDALQAAIDAVEAGDVDSVAGLTGTVTAPALKTALALPTDTVGELTSLDGRLDSAEATITALPATYAPLSVEPRVDVVEADLGGRLSDATLSADALPVATGFGVSALVGGVVNTDFQTGFGITAAGVPYFDTSGASPGEEAVLTPDAASASGLSLIKIGG